MVGGSPWWSEEYSRQRKGILGHGGGVREGGTGVKHDDFRTPKSAWESIAHLLPKDKVIWEPFYGDGKSGEYLEELGFEVIHNQYVDFFKFNLGDIVVSNPPYSCVRQILEKLVYEDDKPFVLLMPVAKLHTQYFQKIMNDKDIQLVVPAKRIAFIKIVNGEEFDPKPLMDCYFYCYKMNLPKELSMKD